MSDNEEFFARWSRRKREANQVGEAEPEPAKPVETHSTPDGAMAAPAHPEVDVSSLPSLDSIDAATDITAFLRKGIPQDLTRAALRRAWTADAAIRDFVGLAENAWDFNDPDAMPGFGQLDCSETELSELVGRIVGDVQQAVRSLADMSAAAEEVGQRTGQESGPEQDSAPTRMIADPASDESATKDVPPASAAPQPATVAEVAREDAPVRRRKNGGALPR
jgi:Protein of unknown function (DUF3306)